MSKVFQVAWREIVSTVATKGFVIGVLVTPALLAVLILVMPALLDEEAPAIEGEVAVLDRTGEIAGRLAEHLDPEAMARRRADLEDRAREAMPRGLMDANPAASMALQAALGEVPKLEVTRLDPDADVEGEKLPLKEGEAPSGGRLALVVVHEDAVTPSDGAFGSYDLFVKEKLDDRITGEIHSGLSSAIVEARVHRAGLELERVQALTRVDRPRSTTVTEEGEQETNEALNMLLPAGFMMLLLISVMTGGQYIMTTTIEEKSSRVVEVLLSAVTPMQLMAGKIVGQMCVGLLILAVYAGMGIAALLSFAVMGFLEAGLLIYLVIFYFIAYFVVASFMAAIGAAVNELREAQTLMTPVMVLLMVPWILWLPIVRNPDSLFATVTSFVPPINTFVMLLRMTSTTPPPTWQVWASIAIGVLSAWAALWFAAKVFRIGLLMHGKPPTFKTLVRWVRMA